MKNILKTLGLVAFLFATVPSIARADVGVGGAVRGTVEYVAVKPGRTVVDLGTTVLDTVKNAVVGLYNGVETFVKGNVTNLTTNPYSGEAK